MAKLTNTQLMVLSNAAARNDGAAVGPPKLNGAGLAKVGSSLVVRKLMREIRSKPGMPVWREDEAGRSISLVIMRAGRDAIGAGEKADKSEQLLHEPHPGPERRAPKKMTVADPHELQHANAAPRLGVKQAMVVDLLSKEMGATIDVLVEATGWLPHSTRAALTGLRKRGFVVERSRDEKQGTVYRIKSQQNSAAA